MDIRLTAAATIALAWALAGTASARILGGPKKSACFATIEDLTPTKGRAIVQCNDGDACDADTTPGECTFQFRVCAYATDTGTPCTPAPVTRFKATKGVITPVPGATSFTCAEPTSMVVRLKGKKKTKQGIKKITIRAKAKGKPDTINATLVCRKGTTSTTIPPACTTKNPAGGPDELDLEVGEQGTDLDNGWTGVAHNFPVVSHSVLQVCLSDCDGTAANPICTVTGKVGQGTANGPVFGPPLPLLAQGVPVCVINRYNTSLGDVTGKINFLTGEVPAATPLQVNLLADTYFTSTDKVCPRCTGNGIGTNGTCDAGNNTGKPCTVDSIITVSESLADPKYGKNYPLSRDCPPASSQFVSTLDVRLPLTTGTSTLAGPTPCNASQDSNCNAGCGTSCSGNACVSKDAQGRCIDAKGGISQNCCNDKPNTSCFPTANGGAITRTGQPGVPSPAPPDPTYPKTGTGVLATTFCETATAKSIINQTTGLPGPAALLLEGTQKWIKLQ
jgi:hypothetical protein